MAKAMKHLGLLKSQVEVTGVVPVREVPPPDYDGILKMAKKFEARRRAEDQADAKK